MIEINNLTKKFGKTTALRKVNLTLTSGTCVGLIGPNACGKTTLIKNILSMVVPTEGEIFFDGKNIQGDVFYKNNIGYMPQIGRYPENMSVRQVIQMIKNIRNHQGTEDKELYEAFEMEKRPRP